MITCLNHQSRSTQAPSSTCFIYEKSLATSQYQNDRDFSELCTPFIFLKFLLPGFSFLVRCILEHILQKWGAALYKLWQNYLLLFLLEFRNHLFFSLLIMRSLCLINEKGIFLIVEIHKPSAFVDRVAAETVPHKNMPIWLEVAVTKVFDVLCNLKKRDFSKVTLGFIG